MKIFNFWKINLWLIFLQLHEKTKINKIIMFVPILGKNSVVRSDSMTLYENHPNFQMTLPVKPLHRNCINETGITKKYLKEK